MSVRRAFEKIGRADATVPKILEDLREAEGEVNEYYVSISLYRIAKRIQISIFIRKDHYGEIISNDFQEFPNVEQAEERFNILVLQYNLKEKVELESKEA